MIRRLLTAAVAFGAATAAHADTFQITDLDKQLHIGASAAIGRVAAELAPSPAHAIAGCLAVGAAKEVAWQAMGLTKASAADMVANGIGCALGVYVIPGLNVSASRQTGINVTFRWRF